ncbi:CmpA/NrtA family ABC transporter substrate-binding protein [Minwuia thermotolerans]|uniref:CmpA/NrtA family ABC transporter substrate-binding protein n=1 Tax=Minwuia thermotolerans TaxID=2056226 RepID=UPI0013DE73FE|nr:CmpA/NrtA family ABC transporter substrate-binding protein [Minwuia thermotolerans]
MREKYNIPCRMAESGSGSENVVRAGFMQLADSAPLIAAAERGFAAEHGIRLELVRQASWANVRDRINIGHLDVAQMLAGMPIASSLGVTHVTVPIIAPFAFGKGGNAIALARGLFDHLSATGEDWRGDPMAAGRALAQVIRDRAARGERQLVLAMVFPFSSHNYELRYWLSSAGVDPDEDVRLVVIPPPMMVESIRNGQVDGFCVGEPWASLAVDAGIAAIVALGGDIWPDAPEKVLGVQESWARQHPDVLGRLLRALKRAADWCVDPGNLDNLIDLLARHRNVAAPRRILRRALTGELIVHPDGTMRLAPDFLRVGGGGLNLPDPEGALWIYSQMVRWRQTIYSEDGAAVARAAYRPDLLGAPVGISTRPEPPRGGSFIDGVAFDPDDIPGYLKQLGMPAN